VSNRCGELWIRATCRVGVVNPASFSPSWTHTRNGLSKRDSTVLHVIHTTYDYERFLKEHE